MMGGLDGGGGLAVWPRLLASSSSYNSTDDDHGHHGHHSIPEGSISIILSCTIVGVLLLQGATRWLETAVEGNRHAADVVGVVFRELTVMGLIAFVLFTSQWSGVLHLSSHDKHIFETIHISLFLISLQLVAWSCGLYFMLRQINRAFEDYETTEVDIARDTSGQTKHDRLMARYHKVEEQLSVDPLSEHRFFGSFWILGLLRHPQLWTEYHRLLAVVRYHDIRRNFLRSHHLPPNFPFARYLQKCEQTVCLKLTEISPTTWIVVVIFVTLDLYYLGISGDELMEDPGRLNAGLSLLAIACGFTVFFKVSWIYWYVLHSEFLYYDPEYSHSGEETAIVGISHQRELFWFDNPGIVITMISFVQFLMSVCATLLMVLRWDTQSVVALACLLGSATTFCLLLPQIVSQFTIVISVGEMSNVPSILHIVGKLREGPEHELWDRWFSVHAAHLEQAERAQQHSGLGGVAHLDANPLRATVLRLADRNINKYVLDEALQMKARASLVLAFLFVVSLDMNSIGHDETLETAEIVIGVLMWLESVAVVYVSITNDEYAKYSDQDRPGWDKSIVFFVCMDILLATYCMLVVVLNGIDSFKRAVQSGTMTPRTVKLLHALTGAAVLLRMVPEIMTFIRHHQHTVEEEHSVRLIAPTSDKDSDERSDGVHSEDELGVMGIQLTNLDSPEVQRRRSTSGSSVGQDTKGDWEFGELDLSGHSDSGPSSDVNRGVGDSPSKHVRMLMKLDSGSMETGPGSGNLDGQTSEEEFDYESKYTHFYNHVLLEGHMWRAMEPHTHHHRYSRHDRKKSKRRLTRKNSFNNKFLCVGGVDPKEYELEWSMVHFVLTRDQILYYKLDAAIPLLATADTVRLEVARQRSSSHMCDTAGGASDAEAGRQHDTVIGPDRDKIPHPLGRVHLNTIRNMNMAESGTQLSLECGSLTLHLRTVPPEDREFEGPMYGGADARPGSAQQPSPSGSPTNAQDVDLHEWKATIKKAIHDEADEDFVDFYSPDMRDYTHAPELEHEDTHHSHHHHDSFGSHHDVHHSQPPPPPPPRRRTQSDRVVGVGLSSLSAGRAGPPPPSLSLDTIEAGSGEGGGSEDVPLPAPLRTSASAPIVKDGRLAPPSPAVRVLPPSPNRSPALELPTDGAAEFVAPGPLALTRVHSDSGNSDTMAVL